MARLLNMQKKKGGAPGGKPDIRQEPLREGHADAAIPAIPAVPVSAVPETLATTSAPPPTPSVSSTPTSPEVPNLAQVSAPQSIPESAPAPLPVSAPAPDIGARVFDEGTLRALPEEAFLHFVQSAFASIGIASQQDILLASIDRPEIGTILKVAKDRNVLSRLIIRPTASSTDGHVEESGPVSAYGATMASNVGMEAPAQPPSQAPPSPAPQRPSMPPAATVAVGARRPPPPPPRRSVAPPAQDVTRDLPESEIGKFHRELRDSNDSTKERLERAEAFFKQKCDEALAKYGKGALEQALVSAKQKQKAEGATPVFEPLEQFMIELGELKKFVLWLNNRQQDELGFHEAKANGKNGDSDKPAALSKPPPAQVQAPAVSGSPSASAQAAPSVQAAPKPKEPTPETIRPSAPPSAAPQAGRLSRFFSNYTTWTVMGIAGFTGALAYTHQFRDLASGAKNIYQFVSGRQINDIPTAAVVGVYSAVMASVLVLGVLITRWRVRSAAQRARERAQRSDADRAKMKYVSRKLTEIMLKCVGEKEQHSQLRQELRRDETLFAAMYYLRKDAVFDDLLEEAGVSKKLRGTIRSTLISQTEQEIMQRKLNRFAEIVYSPRERVNLFRKLYEEDAAFTLICDELFLRNLSGDLVNSIRAKDVFAFVENSTKENVGEPLLKALQQDYDEIISTRKPVSV